MLFALAHEAANRALLLAHRRTSSFVPILAVE
jgi:hypothetical protein